MQKGHRQVQAEVTNRRGFQAVSRTDGSTGHKPRPGLKRWDRQKPGLVSVREQLDSSLVSFILKGLYL